MDGWSKPNESLSKRKIIESENELNLNGTSSEDKSKEVKSDNKYQEINIEFPSFFDDIN